jgi:hypothetical protein
VILSQAVRTIGFCLLSLLPSPFHCVDCVTTVSHENSDRLTGECFRADRCLTLAEPWLFFLFFSVNDYCRRPCGVVCDASAASKRSGKSIGLFLTPLSRIAEVALRTIA